MAGKTKIEWADRVWNPTVGCTPVSSGCTHCYAKRMFERFYQSHKFEDVTCRPERLTIPEKWIKPQRIFVDSMSDLFHEDVPDDFIDRVIVSCATRYTKHHVFMILTKRPERMLKYFGGRYSNGGFDTREIIKGHLNIMDGKHPADPRIEFEWPLPNIWLGVSVEDQWTANERIPLLLQTPAAKRFVSVEPMLGTVDMRRVIYSMSPTDMRGTSLDGIDWVICGGESGPGARPLNPKWVRDLRDQCVAARVPFFFKQWGEWMPSSEMTEEEIKGLSKSIAKHLWPENPRGARVMSFKVGKKKAGNLLDGQVWNEYPGGE